MYALWEYPAYNGGRLTFIEKLQELLQEIDMLILIHLVT